MKRAATILIPLAAVAAWFGYLWFISGVLPFEEKYPNGKYKTLGYVERTGLREYRRVGRWVTYHPNAQKASEGMYEKGVKVEPWQYWDESGRALTEERAAAQTHPTGESN